MDTSKKTTGFVVIAIVMLAMVMTMSGCNTSPARPYGVWRITDLTVNNKSESETLCFMEFLDIMATVHKIEDGKVTSSSKKAEWYPRDGKLYGTFDGHNEALFIFENKNILRMEMPEVKVVARMTRSSQDELNTAKAKNTGK